MPREDSVNPAGERSKVCLIVEASDADSAARVAAAFERVPVAVLVIRPGAGDASAVRGLVQEAQRRGVAALIENDAELAGKVGADGVHLAASADLSGAYASRRASLGAKSIVGVDAGGSRHDAMTVAEEGADYIAFGIAADAPDREEAAADRLDLVQWWAEIFEVPVVAFDVATPEEARDLADAGADFIAVRLATDVPASDAASRVAEIAAAIAADNLAAPA